MIVIGLVESPCEDEASTPLAEWTGELAELVAIEDDDEECEIEEAEGLIVLLASLPVGEAFRRNSDLNFIFTWILRTVLFNKYLII